MESIEARYWDKLLPCKESFYGIQKRIQSFLYLTSYCRRYFQLGHSRHRSSLFRCMNGVFIKQSQHTKINTIRRIYNDLRELTSSAKHRRHLDSLLRTVFGVYLKHLWQTKTNPFHTAYKLVTTADISSFEGQKRHWWSLLRYNIGIQRKHSLHNRTKCSASHGLRMK